MSLSSQTMESKLDKVREFSSPYRPPKEIKSSSSVQDLDEIKLHELKEVRFAFISVERPPLIPFAAL